MSKKAVKCKELFQFDTYLRSDTSTSYKYRWTEIMLCFFFEEMNTHTLDKVTETGQREHGEMLVLSHVWKVSECFGPIIKNKQANIFAVLSIRCTKAHTT